MRGRRPLPLYGLAPRLGLMLAVTAAPPAAAAAVAVSRHDAAAYAAQHAAGRSTVLRRLPPRAARLGQRSEGPPPEQLGGGRRAGGVLPATDGTTRPLRQQDPEGGTVRASEFTGLKAAGVRVADSGAVGAAQGSRTLAINAKDSMPHDAPPGTRSAARAYAFSLMGGVMVVMCTFYLVNWPDHDVRFSTWQVLNMTLSVFCSVLIYGVVKDGLAFELSIKSHMGKTALNSVLFVILLFCLQVMLYAMMKGSADKQMLRSVGTILAHITGFAAMYAGAGILVFPVLSVHAGWGAGFVALAGVVLYAIVLLGEKVRNAAALADDGFISKEEEEWMREVEETEDDVLSIGIGFGIMQVIRRSITGEPNPYQAQNEPLHVTQAQANWLLLISVLLACMAGAFSSIKHQMRVSRKYNDTAINVVRLVGVLRDTSSTTMAWCALFWVEWQLYVLELETLRISCLLVQALFSTVVSFLLILVLDYIADRSGRSLGLRRVIFSLGLLVGFSWERAFDVGFEELLANHGKESIWRHVVPLALAVVVLPAWSMYILPQATPDKQMHAAFTTVSEDIAQRLASFFEVGMLLREE